MDFCHHLHTHLRVPQTLSIEDIPQESLDHRKASTQNMSTLQGQCQNSHALILPRDFLLPMSEQCFHPRRRPQSYQGKRRL